jgi:hypothetical protein
MIMAQMGTDNRTENGRGVWDASYDTTPNSNLYPVPYEMTSSYIPESTEIFDFVYICSV